MTNLIVWNGGECPIKSDKTRISLVLRSGYDQCIGYGRHTLQAWEHQGRDFDIIAYRIIEDHEPMAQTREQITAQIEALPISAPKDQ
jgi:hypothetical protein